MLSDVAGFLVSVLALVLSSRKANAEYSFGYHRAEVIGALASIMIVWIMTVILVYEAIQARVHLPRSPQISLLARPSLTFSRLAWHLSRRSG